MSRAARSGTSFVRFDRSLCEACWECVAACPESVVGKVDLPFHRHARFLDAERCLGCRRCVKVCPTGALSNRRAADLATRPPGPRIVA